MKANETKKYKFHKYQKSLKNNKKKQTAERNMVNMGSYHRKNKTTELRSCVLVLLIHVNELKSPFK